MSGVKRADPMQQFRAAYMGRVAEPLGECEKRLRQLTGEPGGTLGESCGLTLAAGGKRLRPLLVFLTAGKGQGITEAHHAAAVAVELVHMATLVHDDVLDAADLRRGMPTLISRYGPLVSTAAGDYLFSQAFEVLSSTGDPAAISMLASTSLDLSLGELVQREQTRDYGLTPEAYEERCRLKTAGLFSTACSLGALFSGFSDKTIDALDEYGRCLGLAFQIADDILDFSGETSSFGKRSGTDLRDGTVTLPLIMALGKDPSLAEALAAAGGDGWIEKICMRVRNTGALEIAAEEARSFAGRACQALTTIEDEIETEPLGLIAQMAADRTV